MPLESPGLEGPSEANLPFGVCFSFARLVPSELLDMLWMAGLLQLDRLLDVVLHLEFGHLLSLGQALMLGMPEWDVDELESSSSSHVR